MGRGWRGVGRLLVAAARGGLLLDSGDAFRLGANGVVSGGRCGHRPLGGVVELETHVGVKAECGDNERHRDREHPQCCQRTHTLPPFSVGVKPRLLLPDHRISKRRWKAHQHHVSLPMSLIVVGKRSRSPFAATVDDTGAKAESSEHHDQQEADENFPASAIHGSASFTMCILALYFAPFFFRSQ